MGSEIRDVTDTARLIAICRAIESEREDALFRDPFARKLAGQGAESLAKNLIGGKKLPDVMAVRTKIIDDLILNLIDCQGVDLVISLGAGLDTRPYRLSLPTELRWIEVDLPPIVKYKEDLLKSSLPRCQVERQAVDLGDRQLRQQFLSAVVKDSKKALILTEGLLYYLHPQAVSELARDLHQDPVMRYWITDIVSPFQLVLLTTFWGHAFGSAHMLFAPTDGVKTFAEWGYAVCEEVGIVRYGLAHRRLTYLARVIPEKILELPLNLPWVKAVVDSQAKVLVLERFAMV